MLQIKILTFLLFTFQSYPLKFTPPQQAEFQTEVLCAQIDFFLGGNLLTNPSAGSGNHAKIVANAFCFASQVVDKLWIGKSNSHKVFGTKWYTMCSSWFDKPSCENIVTQKVDLMFSALRDVTRRA